MSTFIIAEAGINHNGSLELALRMVDVAKLAGADAIKFQIFKAKNVVSKEAELAQYQQRNDLDTQYNLLKPLELSKKEFTKIKNYCERLDIKFMASPFDLDSLRDLLDIGQDIIKIPSGEITNLPLLRAIGKSELDVIISTGLSNLEEIHSAIHFLRFNGAKSITILHCNTEYPTPMHDVNLNALSTIKETFSVPIGYSDHTVGIEVPIAAVALGAVVIEKHFTLDRTLSGPDHKASLEPKELKAMISAIRNIEKSLGSKVKQITPSEKKNLHILRKSIVARTSIKKGEMFSDVNTTTKRSGKGISPMEWDSVMGKYAIRNFSVDELIEI